MMKLCHILRKSPGGKEFTVLQEKIKHLVSVDSIKLFANNEKGQEIQIERI